MDKNKVDNSKDNKEEKNMEAIIKRPCTVLESLEESLKEMQLMRQGKLPKKSWKEFRKELQEERTKNKE